MASLTAPRKAAPASVRATASSASPVDPPAPRRCRRRPGRRWRSPGRRGRAPAGTRRRRRRSPARRARCRSRRTRSGSPRPDRPIDLDHRRDPGLLALGLGPLAGDAGSRRATDTARATPEATTTQTDGGLPNRHRLEGDAGPRPRRPPSAGRCRAAASRSRCPTSRRRVVTQRKSSPPAAHCSSTVAASSRIIGAEATKPRTWGSNQLIELIAAPGFGGIRRRRRRGRGRPG